MLPTRNRGKFQVMQGTDQEKEKFGRTDIQCAVLIALCFLLTSMAWLSWEYHLLTQIPAQLSDLNTMVAGYLLQAAGIGIYAVLLRRVPRLLRQMIPLILILHILCMIPAVLSPFPAGTLVFGLLMNLVCGIIAGWYLHVLTESASAAHKAAVFGTGYGISILAMWLLSHLGSSYYLIICIVLTAAAVCAAVWYGKTLGKKAAGQEAGHPEKKQADRTFLILAGVLVLLFSIVNSSGFAFSSADLGQAVNVEFSRLAYAAGLVIAGIVSDRSRKYGAVCALAALMIPFIILAMRGEPVSVVIFWLLSYLTFGFYSVFRIILFSDIAAERNLLYLSGFGLLIGRIGDAAGETICLVLEERPAVRIILTAVLFAAAVAVFFRLYQTLYVPEAEQQMSERERFLRFSMEHDLSARERDLLQLILDGKTNGEIADQLFISENTVKFHVKNILQKTGCRNRNDLVAAYISFFQA